MLPRALTKANIYGIRVAFKRLPTSLPKCLKPKRKRFCTYLYAFCHSPQHRLAVLGDPPRTFFMGQDEFELKPDIL